MNESRIRHAVRRGIVVQALLLSVLLTGTVWVLYRVVRGTVYQVYENLSYPRFLDFGYQLRGPVKDPDVCIVGFDGLPVDRVKLARGLAQVKRVHPRVIGVDILLDRIGQPGDDQLAAELRTDIPIVLAFEFEGSHIAMPDSMFLPPNVHTGHAHLRLSTHDQTVRWFKTFDQHGEKSYPSFTAQMAYDGGVPVLSQFPPGINYLINFAGEYGQFGYVTISDLLATADTAALAPLMRNKYVLFGYCADSSNRAPMFRDLFRTPFSTSDERDLEGRMYGVEVHANILHTIINGRRIREWGELPGVLISMVLVFLNLLGQNLFVKISLATRRKLFWLAIGLQFIALVTIPLLLFVLTDQTIDVTVPLIATLIFPKGQELYYRYIDNIGLPFRRWHLRRLPAFVTVPYMEVFKASSLGDRLAAALTTAAVLSPFSRYLLRTGAIEAPARAARLGHATDDLDAVIDRARRILAMYHDVLGRHVAFMEGEEVLENTNAAFLPRAVHMDVTVDPRLRYGASYEYFFLEIMAVVKALLALIRREMQFAPDNGDLRGDHGVISMNTGYTTVPLSPHVRAAVCLKHGVAEYFVRSSPWVEAKDAAGVDKQWIGPTAGCFCNGSSDNPPVLPGGGHVTFASK